MAGGAGRLYWEIGGDTSKYKASLQEALELTDQAGLKVSQAGKNIIAAFDNAINPTKNLSEQIKLLQAAGKSNSDIWKVYGDQISRTTDIAQKHGQAVDPLIKSLKDVEGAANKSRIGFDEVGKAITDFATHPLDYAKTNVSGLLEKLGPTAVGIAGIGTAAIAAGTAIFSFVKSASDIAEHLEIMSAMTGESTQNIQAMEKVAAKAGFEGMDLGRTISYINQQLERDPKQFQEGLEKLGLTTKDTNGHTKTARQLMDELGTALHNIQDPQERAQLAAGALGVRYREVSAFLSILDGTLSENIDTMEKSGRTFSEAGQTGLLQFHDSVKAAKGQVDSWITSLESGIGAAIAYSNEAGKAAEKPSLMKLSIGALLTGDFSLPVYTAMMSQAADAAKKLSDNSKIQFVGPSAKDTAGVPQYTEFDSEALSAIAKMAYEDSKKLREEQEKLSVSMGNAAETLMIENGALSSAEFMMKNLTKAIDEQNFSINHAKDAQDSLSDSTQNMNDFWDEWIKNRHETTGELDTDTGSMDDTMKLMFKNMSEGATQAQQDIDIWTASSQAKFDDMKKSSKQLSGEFSGQFTNLSHNLIKNTLEWKGWSDSIKNFGKGSVSSVLESFVDGLFNPLTSWMNKIGKSLGDWISGLFTGGGKSGGGLLGSIGSAITGGGGGGGTAGSVGGGGGLLGKAVGSLGGLLGIGGGAVTAAGASTGAVTGGLLTEAAGLGAAGVGGAGLLAGSTAAEVTAAGSTGVVGGAGGLSGALGLGGGSGLFGLGSMTIPVIGAAIAAGVIGIPKLIGAIQGDNGYDNIWTNLNNNTGTQLDKDQIAQYFSSKGISEADAYHRSLPLSIAPGFIEAVVKSTAQQQGKWDAVIGWLDKNMTGFGDRIRDNKGWEANWIYESAYGASLDQNLPGWRNKLYMPDPNAPPGCLWVPQFKSGIADVPRQMLAILDPHERVLTEAENRNYKSSSPVQFHEGDIHISVSGSPTKSSIDQLIAALDLNRGESRKKFRRAMGMKEAFA
jgi:hypothetical protein